MRSNRVSDLLLIPAVAAALIAGGCARKEAKAPAAAAQPQTAAPADAGKIPVTTASPEAKAEFLQGRDLFEKLLITDSVAHFERAVALDPNFALAELSLANSVPTGSGFFDHLNKAVALAGKASDGERLMILATQAGANNETAKQKEYLDQLVAAYPNDERAHFNLGGYYFGQQDYANAIEHYKKATELNPTYSTAFNLLGYAYRQNVDYASAEKAFQRYVELIPKDPNPYDSYAELLLKMGRFDEAIAQYRKALEIDPNFLNAHQGIAMALLYSGKGADAAVELDNIAKKARTDGERRTGLFALTVVDVDGGNMAKALADVDQQYALGEKTNDVPGMVGDLFLKGNILLEMGKADDALAQYEKALKMVQGSNLSDGIKQNNERFIHYNRGRVALVKKDLAKAKSEADTFQKAVEASGGAFQKRLAHELLGTIALAEKDYDKAIAELQQANQQNPQDLYRLGKAYQGKGDSGKAKEWETKAADFNSLPNLNYAFVRSKAKADSEKKG